MCVRANIGSCKTWESSRCQHCSQFKIQSLYFKAVQKSREKPSVLTRICKFMSLDRRRVLVKSFIESQFAYCPLVWMFFDKTSDNRINHLHECALRTVYNDNVSTFEKFLEKDNSVTFM